MFKSSSHTLAKSATWFGAALLPMVASAQLSPVPPPPTLCLGSTCVSAASTATSAKSGTIKFHPGTYAWAGTYRPISTAAGKQINLDFIARICSNANIAGVHIESEWAGVEGGTKSDYSAGFAALDEMLAAAQACGKRVDLGISTLHFGNWSPGNEEEMLPDYIVNGSQYGTTLLTGYGQVRGFTARVWQKTTMDAMIDLVNAYGARYNSHPYFEMLSFGESSLNVENSANGYSVDALEVQVRRLFTAARAAFPSSQVRWQANDFWPDSRMANMLQFAKAQRLTVGGPDTRMDDVTQADRVFVGKDEYGNTAFEDLRGVIPWTAGIDSPEMDLWDANALYGNIINGYTATRGKYKNAQTDAYSGAAFVMPTMKASYIFVVNADYVSYGWSSYWLPKINAVSGHTYWGTATQTPCPSAFVNGCNRN